MGAPGIVPAHTHLTVQDIEPYHILGDNAASVTALRVKRHVSDIIQREIPCAYIQRFLPYDQKSPAVSIPQRCPAHIALVGRLLRPYVRMELLPYPGAVESDSRTSLTVRVVLLRAASEPSHPVIPCRQDHAHTQNRHLGQRLAAGNKVHRNLHRTFRSDKIIYLQRTLLLRHIIDYGHSHLLSAGHFLYSEILQDDIVPRILPYGATSGSAACHVIVRESPPEIRPQSL